MIAEAQNGQKVAGYCPMGCGETLVVGIVSKKILCQSPSCPDPKALARIIGTENVVHHIAFIGEDGFALLHPLREREAVEGSDPDRHFDCNLQKWLSGVEGIADLPVPVGVYIVEEIGPEHFQFRPRDEDAAHAS